MRRNYYDTCPCCGAHLDPGEPCDCAYEVERKEVRSVRAMSDIMRDRESVYIKYLLSCKKDASLREKLEQLDKELEEAKEKADA